MSNDPTEVRKRFAVRFEELEIWQTSRRLLKQIYTALASCRDYGFRDQLQRASVSVMNNIAEGFEKSTAKDFAHYLDHAKGSAGEVRSMLYAAADLGIVDQEIAGQLRADYEQLSKSIAAFTRHIRKK